MTSNYGEVGSGTEGRTVRFERRFDASPDELWATLTEPNRIHTWLLAETSFEPRVGGTVNFVWEGSGECSGIVSIFDPPRELEYSWIEAAGTSIVRFEVRPVDGGGVVLVLEHRQLPPSTHAGVGAGWHAHLDALSALLAGERFDFWARFHELEPHYEKLVADI
jgi:uncharacterized protein YndB with AHSA1/START domain